MKKVKFFFTVLRQSLTEPSYYQEIAKAKFTFSLKYLYFLLILVSLAGAIKFSVKITSYIPKIPAFVREVKLTVSDLYPAELVLTVKDGLLSTNVSEPYFIDLPKRTIDFEKSFDHFVVIDTGANIDDFANYKSVVLLTKKYVVWFDDDGGYRVRQIKDVVTDITIDKGYYDNLVDKILLLLNYLPHLAVGAIFASLLVWPIVGGAIALWGRMVWLVVATFFILIIAKIMTKDLGYKKLYQLGMHAVTIPIFLNLFFDLTHQPRPFMLGFLIFMIFMGFILYKYQKPQV